VELCAILCTSLCNLSAGYTYGEGTEIHRGKSIPERDFNFILSFNFRYATIVRD
jgi:hypothetical protein